MSRGELGWSLCERSSAADTAAEFARLRGWGRMQAGERRFRRLEAIRLLMERLTGLSPSPHASKQSQTKSQSFTVFSQTFWI